MTATNVYVGKREEQSRLADTSEIRQRQQHDAGSERATLCVSKDGSGGGESEDSRCHRDRNREDIVDEQGRRREQAGQAPQIVARDHICSAARLVGAHRLPVGKYDDREQCRDRGGDREDEVRRARRGGDEDNECRLGRIGDGGKGSDAKTGQRELLREQGVVHLAARPWPADECSLDGDGSARAPLARPPSCVVSELGEDRRDALVALPCRQAVIAHRRGLVRRGARGRRARQSRPLDPRPRGDARCAPGARGARRSAPRTRSARRGGSRCARQTRAPEWRAPAAPVPGQRLASSEETRFELAPERSDEGSGISPRPQKSLKTAPARRGGIPRRPPSGGSAASSDRARSSAAAGRRIRAGSAIRSGTRVPRPRAGSSGA